MNGVWNFVPLKQDYESAMLYVCANNIETDFPSLPCDGIKTNMIGDVLSTAEMLC